MRILNLYACLGGNRYLWGDEHEVTAVEWDKELARMYQERFPNDIVIVADAHKFLIEHLTDGWDFIWSSPPCPSHSRMRKTNTGVGERQSPPSYADMTLYQEIILLDNFFNGKYCVENVIPYYEPLIPAKKRGRHLYWTNFRLPYNLGDRNVDNFIYAKQSELEKFHKIDLTGYNGNQRKDKIARNLVDYEAGKAILDTAMGVIKKENERQISIFD